MKKSEYIHLKINGRLFPTWVMANFKKYKLPELIRGDDPCNESVKLELRNYQLFLSKYLDNNSIYRDILLYHGLGSGKTATTINLYNVLYNTDNKINVFLLIRASLHNAPWLVELKKWVEKEDFDNRMRNIFFVHYDSPNADKHFFEEMKKANSEHHNMFVIDEVHNFIKNVYGNMVSNTGKKAQLIYNGILKDKLDNPKTRVVCISATPAINTPYELALLFNLLRPGAFPPTEEKFNNIFVQRGTYPSINNSAKNTFQRRIMGLVSFYIGATPDYFAAQNNYIVDVDMSKYQEGIYRYYDEIEKKIAKKSLGKSEMYKTYTRQVCNFAFPYINQNINGESRPRPNKFKVSELENNQLEKGITNIESDASKKYVNAINEYIDAFRKHMDKINNSDNNSGHTIKDDVNDYINKYNSNYNEFEKAKHSALYDELKLCSSKMLRIIFNILLSKGPVLVYSNYVLMEGLQIFKIYLEYFGFINKNITNKSYYNYLEYYGGINQKDRLEVVNMFSDINNKYGENAKILLLSQAGAEGISLSNMRQVHIMEPYWHETRTDQIIGRAIRFCSHKSLPKEERVVDVYKYRSVFSSHKEETSDEYIYNLAQNKTNLIKSFLDPIKEVAIDCMLFREHNKLQGNVRCFQFTEQSLFDKHIGPAYIQDIKDDVKLDNGSNSINSITLKIKVLKIKAVILLNNNLNDPKYSEQQEYWYSKDTNVVYDIDLHYPIGKIAIENGIPTKINESIYVIDKILPIPMIN